MATELTGTQKVAVVLMNLDPEGAASVMKQFTEAEAEEIAAEIIRLRRVDTDVTDKTLGEFYDIAVTGRLNAHGGRKFAEGLLSGAFGTERAAGVLSRVANSLAGKAFEFLDDADPSQIVTLLDGEMPQTAALVLAHLRPAHASKVLAGLSEDVRVDVARRIATMTSATPESISVVAHALKERSVALVGTGTAAEVVGGVQPLIDIINRSDANTERAVLAGLEQSDPELAEEVRSRMVTFADLVKLEARDVQQVLRGIDTEVLAIAMKGASEAVIATIRSNLSERNRELLDDELRTMGPARKSQVEEARAAVVRAIRELEENGGIVIHRTEEDGFVE
ncbi:MAG: flagellar motor switch protein FliG [Microbacteriaceae bacterium]|nr:MAG: flagellar motor switch protein FliG [Microbacteriaceae bacterium]